MSPLFLGVFVGRLKVGNEKPAQGSAGEARQSNDVPKAFSVGSFSSEGLTISNYAEQRNVPDIIPLSSSTVSNSSTSPLVGLLNSGATTLAGLFAPKVSSDGPSPGISEGEQTEGLSGPIHPNLFGGFDPLDWAMQEALRPGSRLRTLPASLGPVRLGEPGRIRFSGELTDQHVAEVLNQQLAPISVHEVQALLNQFTGLDKQIATAVLDVISRSANVEALRSISERLQGEPRGFLYSVGNGSLTDSFSYLADHKKVLKGYLGTGSTNNIARASHLILDEDTLERIESSQELRDAIIVGEVKLVHPLGYVGGLTPYRVTTTSEIAEVLVPLVERVRAACEDKSELVSVDMGALLEAVAKVSIGPENERDVHTSLRASRMTRRILAADVEERLVTADPRLRNLLVVVEPPAHTNTDATDRICSQLNSSQGIDSATVEDVLAHYPAEWRPLMRELVVQQSEVFSPRAMAILARQHREQIVAYAQERGVAPADIVFVVTEPRRSFGMYTHIFREANHQHFSQDQFIPIGQLRATVRQSTDKPVLVVALDDFAGTGESLLLKGKVRGQLRAEIPAETLVLLAPMLATTESFRTLMTVQQHDPHSTMIPARVVAGLQSSPILTSLSEEAKPAVTEAIGNPGYQIPGTAAQSTFISFFYMGPDNNCALFGVKTFNRYFITHQQLEPIKQGGYLSLPSNQELQPLYESQLSNLETRVSDANPMQPTELVTLAHSVRGVSEGFFNIVRRGEQAEFQRRVQLVLSAIESRSLEAAELVKMQVRSGGVIEKRTATAEALLFLGKELDLPAVSAVGNELLRNTGRR